MRQRDVILLIAIWQFLTALGPFMFFLAIGVFMPFRGGFLPFAGFFFGVMFLFVLAWIALAVGAGVGLLQRREWGRVLGLVHAALSLLWFPIGTVIGALVLVYLTREETREYFRRDGGGDGTTGGTPGPPS